MQKKKEENKHIVHIYSTPQGKKLQNTIKLIINRYI